MSTGCEACGKEGARLRHKTDARTFAERRALLCTPCARRGGWADLTFYRGKTFRISGASQEIRH